MNIARIKHYIDNADGGLVWLNINANNWFEFIVAKVKNASSVKEKFRLLVDSDSNIVGVDHLVLDFQRHIVAGSLIN